MTPIQRRSTERRRASGSARLWRTRRLVTGSAQPCVPWLRSSVALLLAVISVACTDTRNRIAEPESGPRREAAIAIPEPYAADVAEAVLRAGGNAVDAAIATAFALAVTYPDAGNIGGGGFMLTWMQGEADFLDYRERAPLAADRDMYLDAAGNVIPRSTLIGPRAAAVPGTVAGLWAAHQRHGTLPWRDLVLPAVRLAEEGFVPPAAQVAEIRDHFAWFEGSTDFETHFASITPDRPFRQPALAATLSRIAATGREAFYGGETAALIVAEMESADGLITAEDLTAYEAVWREPLTASWRDYEVLTAPPPSSGGFAVIALLKMKDALAAAFAGVEHNSPQYVHLVSEMEKRVFADRAEYLGDPDFVEVDMQALIDDEYLARRAAEVNEEAISSVETVVPGLLSPSTTHFSIVDGDGNAVSNTYTINWSYGSGVVVSGAGFLLNNEMDDFSAKAAVPNVYGVVGGQANEIEPGKRPLSSMSPTILLRGGEVEMVIGTPGGSTIFTSVFQTIVNVLDFAMTPQEAVGATRFHHQLLPPDLVTMSIATPLSENTIAALRARGYRVEPHAWEFGDVQLINRGPERWQPAADPRDRGVARVVQLEPRP